MTASKAARRFTPNAASSQPQRPPPVPPPKIPDNAHLTFSQFAKLPVELRAKIWRLAIECRPRVIQIFYNPDEREWQACKDGRGGLPRTRTVSREARAETLKGYTTVFGTLIDLQVDTVFISDPMLTIRKQQDLLLSMDCVRTLKKLAFDTDVFTGLEESFYTYPAFCDSAATIIRKFDQLEHFSLLLHGDQVIDDYDYAEEESSTTDAIDGSDDLVDDGGADLEIEKALESLEQEASEKMSKQPYFRHTGNLHFESAYYSNDFWDSFEDWRESLEQSFESEKEEHGGWKRPRFSIAEVKYGLNQVGDFDQFLHSNGDYPTLPLEHEGEETPPDLVDYASDTNDEPDEP